MGSSRRPACIAATTYTAQQPTRTRRSIRAAMRTLPMASVCRHDVVNTQSLAHFLARDAMFLREAATVGAPVLPSAATAYTDLIVASVLQLALAGAP